MINDARTLLLNISGPREENPDIPGDVYIPTYDPVDLSAALENVKDLLFSIDADYEGLVYRAAQYMLLLDSTPYRDYLFVSDSRITYDPLASDIAEAVAFGNTVVTTSSQDLTVNGVFDQPALSSQILTSWRILGEAGNRLRVTNTTEGLESVQQAFAGIPLTLVGSDLTFEISGTSIVSGDVWRVDHREKPTPNLGTLLATLANMTPSMRDALFGAERTRQEPYTTFSNLFTRHYALPYRMSGVLLALIQRTREAANVTT